MYKRCESEIYVKPYIHNGQTWHNLFRMDSTYTQHTGPYIMNVCMSDKYIIYALVVLCSNV